MNTHDRTQSFFGRRIRPLLFGVAVGIVVCTLLLMLMAAVIQRVDIPAGAALPLAVGAAAAGAFLAGLTAALVAGQRGLLMGAVSGLLLYLPMLVAGLARYSAVDGGASLLKLAVLVAAGAVGGVLGVNRR
jgi:putative membrane protein (TIGR04086 family)